MHPWSVCMFVTFSPYARCWLRRLGARRWLSRVSRRPCQCIGEFGSPMPFFISVPVDISHHVFHYRYGLDGREKQSKIVFQRVFVGFRVLPLDVPCTLAGSFVHRRRRQQGTTLKNVTPLGTAYLSTVELYGLRMERSDALVDYDDRGVPQILVQRNTTFRLFGSGWTDKTLFVLTEKVGGRGSPCEFPVGDIEEVRTHTRFGCTAHRGGGRHAINGDNDGIRVRRCK